MSMARLRNDTPDSETKIKNKKTMETSVCLRNLSHKKGRVPRAPFFLQPLSLTRRNWFIHCSSPKVPSVHPAQMSDAQAAHVTENGAPPATQDALVPEATGFKVLPRSAPSFLV